MRAPRLATDRNLPRDQPVAVGAPRAVDRGRGTASAPQQSASEQSLLVRIRNGDEGAFEELFTAHYQGMCALAYTFVRSREAAEDIVGNVFQNLWLRRLEWDVRVPLQSYLLTATRNTAIDLLRRIRREAGLAARALSADVVPAFSAPATPPDRAVIAQDLAAAIEQVISELPPRCREVFALRWQGGLRHQEIASRVGVSLKTVEMHITRALKVIRERVQGYL